jgi:hypothetical protein
MTINRTINNLLKNNRLFYTGIAISVLFLLINILTLNWYPLPWVDEVMFTDTPANVVLTGKWFSTVWRYTYNPLHAFLLIPWIWCFGISHAAVTSLNVVIAFFLCILMLRFLINTNIINSLWSLIIFLLMFWGASTISWIFRCGRVDVLAMLFSFLVVTEILKITQSHKKKYIKLFLFSLLLFLTSISPLPVIIYLFLVLFISQTKDRKIILEQAIIFASACMTGLFVVSVFYWHHDSLLHYLNSFISSNATLSEKKSFLSRLIRAYLINKDALIFSFLNIFIIAALLYKKETTLKSINVIFLFSCLFIPLIMTLAGRFALYYSWLFFLPTLIITISLFDNSSFYIKILISLITAIVFISGLPFSLSKADRLAIARINSFIANQPITSNSTIISDYLPYFAIKNISNKCYFPGANPNIVIGKPDSTITTAYGLRKLDAFYKRLKIDGKSNFLYKSLKKQILSEDKPIFVDKIDFIIKAPQSYGSDSLNVIMTKQKSIGKIITPIDSLNNPKIIIYRVK